MRWAPSVTAAAALLLALGRLRKPGSLLLALALTVAILVGGFAGLLVLGSSQQAKDAVAKDPQILGLGIYAIAIGGWSPCSVACSRCVPPRGGRRAC